MKSSKLPTLKLERAYQSQGYNIVGGIDEVGRGSIAGPLVACLFVCPYPQRMIAGVNDSKLLTPSKRQELSIQLKEQAKEYAITALSAQTIDSIGIQEATKSAFEICIKHCPSTEAILIDGRVIANFNSQGIPVKWITRGDQLSYSIAAASILAKNFRDEYMIKLSVQYPGYYLEKNKGYGTKLHVRSIKNNGISRHHRKTFLTKSAI